MPKSKSPAQLQREIDDSLSEGTKWFVIWTWFGPGANANWQKWAHPTTRSTYLRPFAADEVVARKFAQNLSRKGAGVTVTSL